MIVEKLKTKFNFNEPIFTNEILEMFDNYSYAYVFRLLKQEVENNEIVNFDKGVYFIPSNTIFGQSTITAEDVVKKKYINDDKSIYGLYSGLSLQNMFALTTQMPNIIEIVSNNESMRCRKITIDGRCFILRKSRCEINNDNVSEYTILQLLSEIKKIDEIDENSRRLIYKYIEESKIKLDTLIELSKFFPSKTTKNLIYSGVLNEIA